MKNIFLIGVLFIAKIAFGQNVSILSSGFGTTDNNLSIASGLLNTNKAVLLLTDGSTITWNTQANYNAKIILGGSHTLAMTNIQNGTWYSLTVFQDGTGSRVLTLPGGATATISGTASDSTVITDYYHDDAHHWYTALPFYKQTQTISGVWTYNPGSLISGANSTSAPAHKFTASGASLETSPAAGDMEVDANGVPYYTFATSQRGVMDAEQFISLTSSYTLTSQTAVQKIFNSTTNGQVTVSGSTSYYFDCFYSLSSMSSTSGSFGFAFGGTATFTSQAWQTSGFKASTVATAGTAQTTFNTTANTTLVTANTSTAGIMHVWGIVRINAGGTLIPQVSLGIAAAAVVGVNSYFRAWPIGTNTITNVGNWN